MYDMFSYLMASPIILCDGDQNAKVLGAYLGHCIAF